MSLPELRRVFHSQLREPAARALTPPPSPPAGVFELVRYPAPLGPNAAYVTPVHADGTRRPAILWVIGGFDWSIDATPWTPANRDNDQSARAFRERGIVTMYPSFRGCNDNPGRPEYFLGEVDDLLAAAEFLTHRADVDPARIYIGGHSTGGTMVLLAAAGATRFRAVFALGPVPSAMNYRRQIESAFSDTPDEWRMRSPGFYVDQITAPTWIIEGATGNAAALPLFEGRRGHAPVHTVLVAGGNHFDTIVPATEVIAAAILADTGTTSTIAIDAAAIERQRRAP